MTMPPITSKQQHILSLLYTYRFLTTTQLQAFMGHKDKRRLLSWLRDLRSKHYIGWHYDTSFIGRTKPASYYLETNGIRYIRSQGKYPEAELRKRYRDSSRQPAYIEVCHAIAAACAAMDVAFTTGRGNYAWSTLSLYHQLDPTLLLVELKPSLIFARLPMGSDSQEQTNYLLEVCRRTTSLPRIRARLRQCLRYIDERDWEETFPTEPTLLFVCPDKQTLKAMKRMLLRMMENDVSDHLPVHFATIDDFVTKGAGAAIWEAV